MKGLLSEYVFINYDIIFNCSNCGGDKEFIYSLTRFILVQEKSLSNFRHEVDFPVI